MAGVFNLLKKAIEEKTLLPKAIAVILDDDMIKQTKFSGKHLQDFYADSIKHLMEKFHREITAYKEHLPVKAKQDWLPHILWFVPPNHKYFNNNNKRNRFAHALQSAVEGYTEMACLELKKVWNEDDGALYLRPQARYTDQGLLKYWMAVDAAFKFWDKTLIDILIKRQKKDPTRATTATHLRPHPQQKTQYGSPLMENRFKWVRDSSESTSNRRRLPTLPNY